MLATHSVRRQRPDLITCKDSLCRKAWLKKPFRWGQKFEDITADQIDWSAFKGENHHYRFMAVEQDEGKFRETLARLFPDKEINFYTIRRTTD